MALRIVFCCQRRCAPRYWNIGLDVAAGKFPLEHRVSLARVFNNTSARATSAGWLPIFLVMPGQVVGLYMRPGGSLFSRTLS